MPKQFKSFHLFIFCLILIILIIAYLLYQQEHTFFWFSSELPTSVEILKNWDSEKRFNNLYKLSRWEGFISGVQFNRFVREQIKGLSKNSTDKFNFLEVGVGVGAFAMEILKMFPYSKGEGIDIVPGAIEIAKVVLPPDRMKVKIGDMIKVEYNSSSFDVVYVPGAICYLLNMEEVKVAVSEFHRVLKTGGGICLSMVASDTSALGSCNTRIPKSFWLSLPDFTVLLMDDMDGWHLPHSFGRYCVCLEKNISEF